MQSNNAFVFKSHVFDPEKGEANFNYQITNENEVFDFCEKLSFPIINHSNSIPENLLKNILDSLHLVLGISYYKLFCPKELVLEGITLSKTQAEFWNTIYAKGLGEFFYKNNIDFRNLISFPFSDTEESPISFSRQNRSLLGIGGGKDSIVAGELLKKLNKPFSAFAVNVHPIMEETIHLLGVDSVFVKRIIDPLLFDLNKRTDTYNGHVPVSAQNAFIGLLTAVLFDYKDVVMANEQSANYGNIDYLGQEVNHQWSKSYEFESLFKNYVKTNITSDINYFSILRPFTEIKIAKIFSENPKHFPIFSSCNKNFQINNKADKKWCCECPKCVFTFVMLSAFLSKKELVEIFGQNLFEKEKLLQIYKELLGISEIKPFDCVGTPEEVKVAMCIASEKREYENDCVMQFFNQEILPAISDIEELKEQVFKASSEHHIPKEFEEVLKL